MDKFVIITPGLRDSKNKNVIRVTPSCYSKIAELSDRTGVSMCRIIGQCVDFALDHMVDEECEG
ncbi:hypothetical protein [Congzhengia minquanensis]|uniref:Uncharacterized protein n=1 Tax=Congzhengia minquanensis TaxID=2763657 RepID=A0A926DKL6_9FIRM|nr:hypothetical protein [Congzhengia minquanensis]MBC8540653.1 hypothetical protein [Congzhengia minquanensis]